MALTQNPNLRAARQDIAIAEGGVQQSRLWRFNPDFAVVAPGTGLNGSRNASEYSLTQEVEIAGQRGLRIDAARRGIVRATAAVANSTRLLLADVSVAYYRAFAAQRRLQVTSELLQLTEQLLAAVRVQLREGEISALEANLAEIEFGRARGRRLSAQRDASTATLELARLIGVGPEQSLRLANDSTTISDPIHAITLRTVSVDANQQRVIDSLTAIALSRRPDIAENNAAIREVESAIALTRREALPNLRLGFLAERNQGESTTRFGPAIGFGIPLFNRSQGVVAQRRAELQQATFRRDAVQLQIRTEIESTVRALSSANAEVEIFESSVRQPARANNALLDAAFRAGKIALPTLLLLRNQLLDAELDFWQAWLARQEALMLLDSATGTLTADQAPESLLRPAR